ncbi:hypothetical protein [Gemmatimonas sp.]|uniref:hypothetical protein n=1 Tax=Gemmatimonas sp. TaxID=1962908 RepID=UPI00333FE867
MKIPFISSMALAPRRVRLVVLFALGLIVPTLSGSQSRRCPRYARVPGYGACSNIGGSNCGFCTYRCNDDTVVRWNVCAG